MTLKECLEAKALVGASSIIFLEYLDDAYFKIGYELMREVRVAWDGSARPKAQQFYSPGEAYQNSSYHTCLIDSF